jgi:predicted carbohydrate-binding protein with CBM5 and CBM33 domain
VRVTRIIAGAGAGLIAVVSFAVLTNRSEVQAHGGMTFPSTRTHACYVNGRAGSGGGDLMPTNEACKAAIAQGGKQPLWDWFGNLLGNAGANWKSVVPDGKLCGPSDKYDAYNAPRADWPTTNVQSGAQVTLRYNAWAAHPGTWTQWVTRDGFDVTQPLKWSDLDAEPFSKVTNPPINGSGPEGAEYTWPARLPTKSGRHIIYSVWTRSDSPEVFYNCSDVVFTGGGGSPQTTAATTSTSATTTTTTRPPSTAITPPPPTTPRPTTTTTATPSTVTPTTLVPTPGYVSCEATAAVTGTFGGLYWATVTVRNPTKYTLLNWRVSVRLAPGAGILFGWNATIANNVATPLSSSATLNADGSVSFGFLAYGPAAPAPVVSGCSAGVRGPAAP